MLLTLSLILNVALLVVHFASPSAATAEAICPADARSICLPEADRIKLVKMLKIEESLQKDIKDEWNNAYDLTFELEPIIGDSPPPSSPHPPLSPPKELCNCACGFDHNQCGASCEPCECEGCAEVSPPPFPPNLPDSPSWPGPPVSGTMPPCNCMCGDGGHGGQEVVREGGRGGL